MAKILVHSKGRGAVSSRSGPIEEGDLVDIGKQQIKVMHTPGHCPEHISLVLGENVFVGDTLFLSGCGNTKFGGNIDELYKSIAFKLRPLPESFKVFVGHDYSETNLRFALSVEPENKAARAKLEEVKSAYSQGKESAPTTIGEEKKYNPFFRFDVHELVIEMKKRKPSLENDPRAIFTELRELRNNWN
jgi:hydroxyacylglutathione hydrolase